MHFSTSNLDKNVMRTKTCSFLWLELHLEKKEKKDSLLQIAHSIILTRILFSSSWWHYTGLQKGRNVKQEVDEMICRWSWTVCGVAPQSSFWLNAELSLQIWQIRRWWICWQVTFALNLSHRWATSCHGVVFCLNKCPSAHFMGDIWVSEQQANHAGQVGGVKSGFPLEFEAWHSLLSLMNNIILHIGLVELKQLQFINVSAAVRANSFPWMPNEAWVTHLTVLSLITSSFWVQQPGSDVFF